MTGSGLIAYSRKAFETPSLIRSDSLTSSEHIFAILFNLSFIPSVRLSVTRGLGLYEEEAPIAEPRE